MDATRQWVAYRAAEGEMLRAPLPSAPEVGPGWRGVALRRFHPLDQLDPIVIETADRVGVALGIAVDGDTWGYGIGAAEGSEPVRFVLGVDPGAPAAEASEPLARCGVTGRGLRWRKAATKALAAWSAQAPRSADSVELEAVLDPELTPLRAAEVLLELIGLRMPLEPIPDPLDLQHVAREQLEPNGHQPSSRRRWFARR